MAIQVRRGNEADFDPSKMLPGEWAVSLDAKYVRMCFAPGLCLRMATYESFEEDMVKIQQILTNVQNIEDAVKEIQEEINGVKVQVEETATLANSYAQEAKEYADNAYLEAERAKEYAGNTLTPEQIEQITQNKNDISKLYDEKIDKPKDSDGNVSNGTSGQILQTNGDGTTQWVDMPSGGGSGGSEDALTSADVVDNLLSTATDLPLSANQGRVLNEKLSYFEGIEFDNEYITLHPYKAANLGYISKYGKFKKSISNGNEVLLGKLPEGFRPPGAFRTIICVSRYASEYAGTMQMWMLADGTMYIRTFFDINTTTDYVWAYTYPIGLGQIEL